jgi:hypothetical protein
MSMLQGGACSAVQRVHIRSARKVAAAMRAALRPRLLVLVGLAAAAAAYNSIAPEPLNGVQSAALFGGFLTYKAGQLVSDVHAHTWGLHVWVHHPSSSLQRMCCTQHGMLLFNTSTTSRQLVVG